MTESKRRKGRTLGVDLGIKRTGLGLSDELGLTTRALETLKPKSRAEDIAYILSLVDEFEVKRVVFGLPLLTQSGEDSPMTRRARRFARAFYEARQARDCLVVLVDEAHSSREASERLVASGVKKTERKARLDGEAACIIIERYWEGAKEESF